MMPEKKLSLPLKEKVAMPSSPNESAGERLQSITKSANKIGYTLNAYLAHNNIPQLAKLADYLGCNEEDWVAFRIEDLNLSVRSLNCLRGKASTVAELLKLKVYNIANAKGMGVKSFEEIIDVLRKLVEGTSDRECDLAYSNNAAFALNQDLLQYRDAIISGHWDKIATQELGIECTQQIDQLKDAYELLGADMVKYFSSASSSVLSTLNALSAKMSQLAKEYKQLLSLVEAIPSERLSKNALGFISAYSPSNTKIQDALLLCFGDEKSILEDVLTCNNAIQPLPVEILFPFLRWCAFSIDNEVKETFASLNRDDRNIEILQMRSQGLSLNDVGSAFGLTRERVRQIESKISNRFEKAQKKHHTLLKISALCNGDTVLTADELKPFLGEHAACLIHLFKITPSKDYSYSRRYHAFTIGLAGVEKQVEDYVDSLPDKFSVKEYEQFLSKAEEEHGLPRELVEMQIKAIYNQSDVLFYQGKLSSGAMCARVLGKYYSQGIHVYDEENLLEFRNKILEEFGSDTQITDSLRAISVRIASVGILSGRGIYRPKSNAYISDSLAEKIKQYIIDYEYPIVLMNTLFAEFQTQLEPFGIDNKYYLQGILKEKFGDEFHFKRDYISRDADATSFYSSIIEYIRGFDYPISKAQIMTEFQGVSDIIITVAAMDESIINYFGEYLHVDHLKIPTDDRRKLKGYVDELLRKESTSNSRTLYNYIEARMPHLLKRWYIRFHFQLFSVCEYLFGNEYQFERPYVALNGTKIIRQEQMVLDYLSETKTTKITDLFEYLKSRQIRTGDILKFLDSLNEEYLLVNKSTLMRIDDIGVTREHCQRIEELILNEISDNTPIKELICTYQFPRLNVRWTDWLIYSVLNKWSTKLEVHASHIQFRYAVPIVAIKGSAFEAQTVIRELGLVEENTYMFDDLDEDIEEMVAEYLEEEDIDDFI